MILMLTPFWTMILSNQDSTLDFLRTELHTLSGLKQKGENLCQDTKKKIF